MNNKFDMYYYKNSIIKLVILILIILCFYFNYISNSHSLNITENYQQKPIIWLYWQNKPGKTMPVYLQLCLDTIYKKCNRDFEINLLNEKTVYNYLPDLRTDLEELQIAQKTDYIRIDNDKPSGVAIIMVDNNGENSISVAPGANNSLTIKDVDFIEEKLKADDYVLIQLDFSSKDRTV